MKKEKNYKIFALVLKRQVYIGKTYARRLSAIYHRHCRGEVVATACFSENSETPKLHLLFHGEKQAYEAYRHILAYINVFKESGYQILNCPKSIDRSSNLHSETQVLVEQLKMQNVDKILARTLVKNPIDADDTPVISEVEPEKNVAGQKITIRVSLSEKQEYMQIGAELSLNQRETLQYLFAKAKQVDSAFLDLEGDSYLRALVNAYREENTKLKKRHAELHEKLAISRADKRKKLAQKNKQIEAIQKGIQGYFATMQSACKIPVGLEIGKYEEFLRTEQYQFPEKPGLYMFRPQEILRSKGRWGALFILGKGDDNKFYKFRWYPKDYFVGINIQNHKFGKRGSVWLIGCEQASDGAMDLIFAFPLEVQFRYNGPEEYGSEVNRFVADLLKEIESYQDS